MWAQVKWKSVLVARQWIGKTHWNIDYLRLVFRVEDLSRTSILECFQVSGFIRVKSACSSRVIKLIASKLQTVFIKDDIFCVYNRPKRKTQYYILYTKVRIKLTWRTRLFFGSFPVKISSFRSIVILIRSNY